MIAHAQRGKYRTSSVLARSTRQYMTNPIAMTAIGASAANSVLLTCSFLPARVSRYDLIFE
jgi:hypothetical protein